MEVISLNNVALPLYSAVSSDPRERARGAIFFTGLSLEQEKNISRRVHRAHRVLGPKHKICLLCGLCGLKRPEGAGERCRFTGLSLERTSLMYGLLRMLRLNPFLIRSQFRTGYLYAGTGANGKMSQSLLNQVSV